jgi:hypothetical protein
MTAKVVRPLLRVLWVLAALLLVAVVVVGGPYVIKYRIRSNEATARVSLRKITALANAYIEKSHSVDSVCGPFSSNAQNDRLEQGQVRAVFEEALKHDYQLEFRNCSQVAYRIVANPIHSGPIAPYRFCSDQTGVTHFAPSPSTCDDTSPIWAATRP